MLIKAQCSDRDGKKRNSSAQSPCEAYCRENIVFKLITCFMYLDGRTSRGYLGSVLGLPDFRTSDWSGLKWNITSFFLKIAFWGNNSTYCTYCAQYSLRLFHVRTRRFYWMFTAARAPASQTSPLTTNGCYMALFKAARLHWQKPSFKFFSLVRSVFFNLPSGQNPFNLITSFVAILLMLATLNIKLNMP